MEAHPEPVAMLPRLLEQRRRLSEIAPELARKTQFREFGRDPQPHEQTQILRRLTGFAIAAGIDDLRQLLLAVEAEGCYPVLEVSLSNRGLGLDRMHEAKLGFGQQSANQANFRDRCHIVVIDTCLPQHTEQARSGIGFDSVEHLARKLLDKEAGGARRCVRAVEDYGLVRRESADYSLGIRIGVQLKGPPEGSAV